jgi:mannose/fructose/N-acetylgalactosamine-specific phosphotransferase system component IID
LTKLVAFVRKTLQGVINFLFSNRYHLDDIIVIVRPFIFVYCVMQYGHKSYTPIKISFVLDMISILLSFSRLVQSANASQPQ